MRKVAIALLVIGFVVINPTSGDSQLATSLRITVLDNLGNIVEGATVTLFATEEDYRNEENALATMMSDGKGRVTFKKLESVAYFVYVVKGDMNNIGGGVQTDVLEAGKMNKVNIIIE